MHLDAPTYNLLKEINTDIPIVQVNQFSDYQFNPALYDLDKYILADFLEYGANSFDFTTTHFWGKNSEKFKLADSDEWRKFDQFVKDKEPTVYFKRELLSKDISAAANVYPIEFPCIFPIPAIQTQEEFNKRPIELLFVWGHSHELRRATQGNIFLNSSKSGYGVVDNFYHFEQATKEYKRIWATIQTPHYSRIPMEQVLFINGQSKLSLSLPGAGAKCFRMTESSINAVMVMREDGMEYSFPWIHGINCIKIPMAEDFEEVRGVKNTWKVIDTIEAALQRTDLYQIYANGVENCAKYSVERYCTEYLEPIIKKHL